jgi:N-acetylglucosaminyl-diphospho-decaprenol L-rhamnosyltransferase
MTVFVLIPVFNRLHHTQRVVEALRAQVCPQTLSVIVIDDGSSDGTADWLNDQQDIIRLAGNGQLWWGGSIELGLQFVLDKATDEDYVLFVNNDTWFEANYVAKLCEISRENADAIVGSVVHEENCYPPLVSIGPRININRLAVWDIFNELDQLERIQPRKTYSADALSGRGTLYPVPWFKQFGTMRPTLLPHYLSDYEISMRFARHGARLLVSSEAITFSLPVYGVNAKLSWWDRLFSERSPSNIIRRTLFYSMVGSPLQRMTGPLRIALFSLKHLCNSFPVPRGKGL